MIGKTEVRACNPALSDLSFGDHQLAVLVGGPAAGPGVVLAVLIGVNDGPNLTYVARLGPRSLGRHTRFVVDHAPCPVLLVWPDTTPSVESIPPPPDHHASQAAPTPGDP